MVSGVALEVVFDVFLYNVMFFLKRVAPSILNDLPLFLKVFRGPDLPKSSNSLKKMLAEILLISRL